MSFVTNPTFVLEKKDASSNGLDTRILLRSICRNNTSRCGNALPKKQKPIRTSVLTTASTRRLQHGIRPNCSESTLEPDAPDYRGRFNIKNEAKLWLQDRTMALKRLRQFSVTSSSSNQPYFN